MKYANEYQKVEQAFLNFAPRGVEVKFGVLNDYLKYPGWDAPAHRGWMPYHILQEMAVQGMVEQTVSGPGRDSKYKLI
jgi:hypothetical protein